MLICIRSPVQKKAKLEKDQAELSLLEAKYTELEASYSDALRGREETVSPRSHPIYHLDGSWILVTSAHSLTSPQMERTTLLTELETLTQTSSNLKAEIEAYGASDPIKMEQKRRAIEIAKEACLLWTGERFQTF